MFNVHGKDCVDASKEMGTDIWSLCYYIIPENEQIHVFLLIKVRFTAEVLPRCFLEVSSNNRRCGKNKPAGHMCCFFFGLMNADAPLEDDKQSGQTSETLPMHKCHNKVCAE